MTFDKAVVLANPRKACYTSASGDCGFESRRGSSSVIASPAKEFRLKYGGWIKARYCTLYSLGPEPKRDCREATITTTTWRTTADGEREPVETTVHRTEYRGPFRSEP